MKRAAVILILLLSVTAARAGGPRLSWGLEWGYTATFLRTSQHNFVCAEGYRIIENPDTWRYFSNGSLLAGVGMDVFDKFNASLYSGLLGVYSKRWVVPAELRLTYCPTGLHTDGLLFHAGAALTYPTSVLQDSGWRAEAGAGYRIAVFGNVSVDFKLSLNITLDHDILTDPDTGLSVPRSDIKSDTSEYHGINVSLGINF